MEVKFDWFRAGGAVDGRPTAIFLGWVGADAASLQPYAEAYNRFGWDVLAFRLPFLSLWFPQWAFKNAVTILDCIMQEFVRNGPRHIIFVIFSGAAKMCYYQLLEILGGKCKQHDFCCLYSAVKDNCVGQVYDSSPVDFTSQAGVTFLTSRNKGLVGALTKLSADFAAGCLDFFLVEWFEKDRQRMWDVLSHPPISGPLLFLYSLSDNLADPAQIRQMAASIRGRGRTVLEHVWSDAPHMKLLRTHPTEYIDALGYFLGLLPPPRGGGASTFRGHNSSKPHSKLLDHPRHTAAGDCNHNDLLLGNSRQADQEQQGETRGVTTSTSLPLFFSAASPSPFGSSFAAQAASSDSDVQPGSAAREQAARRASMVAYVLAGFEEQLLRSCGAATTVAGLPSDLVHGIWSAGPASISQPAGSSTGSSQGPMGSATGLAGFAARFMPVSKVPGQPQGSVTRHSGPGGHHSRHLGSNGYELGPKGGTEPAGTGNARAGRFGVVQRRNGPGSQRSNGGGKLAGIGGSDLREESTTGQSRKFHFRSREESDGGDLNVGEPRKGEARLDSDETQNREVQCGAGSQLDSQTLPLAVHTWAEGSGREGWARCRRERHGGSHLSADADVACKPYASSCMDASSPVDNWGRRVADQDAAQCLLKPATGRSDAGWRDSEALGNQYGSSSGSSKDRGNQHSCSSSKIVGGAGTDDVEQPRPMQEAALQLQQTLQHVMQPYGSHNSRHTWAPTMLPSPPPPSVLHAQQHCPQTSSHRPHVQQHRPQTTNNNTSHVNTQYHGCSHSDNTSSDNTKTPTSSSSVFSRSPAVAALLHDDCCPHSSSNLEPHAAQPSSGSGSSFVPPSCFPQHVNCCHSSLQGHTVATSQHILEGLGGHMVHERMQQMLDMKQKFDDIVLGFRKSDVGDRGEWQLSQLNKPDSEARVATPPLMHRRPLSKL